MAAFKHSIGTVKRLILGTLLASLAGCDAPHFTAEDKAAIRARQAAFVADYNANDWDALAGHFALNGVLMPPGHSKMIGREAIAAWERNNEQGFHITLTILNMVGDGDLAYVMGSSCLTIPGDDGPIYDRGSYLEIRERGPGNRWLITSDIFNSDGQPTDTPCDD